MRRISDNMAAIAQISKAAQAACMSYGEYVAKGKDTRVDTTPVKRDEYPILNKTWIETIKELCELYGVQTGYQLANRLKIKSGGIWCRQIENIPNEYYPTISGVERVAKAAGRYFWVGDANGKRFYYTARDAQYQLFPLLEVTDAETLGTTAGAIIAWRCRRQAPADLRTYDAIGKLLHYRIIIG